MAYRRRGGAMGSSRTNPQAYASAGQKDYGSLGSGSRRHQVLTKPTGFVSMATNEYGVIELARFRRTFNPAVADVEPTATQSNNYQSLAVMNGSLINRYKCVINIENNANDKGFYLDIYEIQLSFWDGFIWENIFPTRCPVTFEQAAPESGQITFKAITAALVFENDIKGFKFLQHFMRRKGTIYLGPLGQENAKAQLVMTRVPSKVRRANNGMFWGLILHNSTDKNGGLLAGFTCSAEYDFNEIPTNNRLPYIT